MADGRQIKGGIVLHPIIATAILGAVIASATFMYRSFSTELAWQHDQLITLSVQKVEADKRATEKAEELSKRLQNMDAVQIVLGRDIAKLQEARKARN
jgi:hypothetical protein